MINDTLVLVSQCTHFCYTIQMNKQTQIFFASILIAPLCYILVSDYKSVFITLLSVLIAFLIWYFQEKIRANHSLMRLFKELF